ncbi:MAG: paraquat-inducible protein A [Puniceicoccales bacterium]
MSVGTDAIDRRELVACPSCDTLHRTPESIRPGQALCSSCGQTLYKRSRHGTEHTLAWSLAGLILFIPANAFPLVMLSSYGIKDQNQLITGPLDLLNSGLAFPLVGLLVLLTSILFPVVFMAALAYISLCDKLRRYPRDFAITLRLAQALYRWSMVDVYILACLVAFVKLADLADLHARTGLYCLAAVLLCSLLATTSFDPHQTWRRFAKAKEEGAKR